MSEDVLSAALGYARRGWHVFPVRGKVPAIERGTSWREVSTTDAEQIAAWWAGTSGLGIGVDLDKSHLAVVDIDHLDQFDIDETHLGDGWTYRGNRGRLAYMYSVNGHPIPQAGHKWGEVKAAGGYVVLPPSPHPHNADECTGGEGCRYEWLDQRGDEPPVLPFDLEPLIAPVSVPRAEGVPWDGEASSEALRMAASRLAGVCDRLAAMPGASGRNRALYDAANGLGHYVPHLLDEQEVADALVEASKRNGLVGEDGERSVRASIKSGLAKGMAEPEGIEVQVTLLDVPSDVSLEDRVFGYSPITEAIRQAGRARVVSPWAVLGATLAIVLAEVPPHYVIPPMIGGAASLNFAVALVGPSGTGKSSAVKVARELLGNATTAKRIGPGTGEGLVMSFMEKPPGSNDLVLVARPHALLYADEVGQLGALNERNGATQASILRALLTGEDVFTTNAERARRRHLPAGAYRLAVVAGVQPGLADVILADKEAGGPQRFAWLPTIDPRMPDTPPAWPATVAWSLPIDPGRKDPLTGQLWLGFPGHVEAEVRAHMLARVRGKDAGLDGHLLLTRLKVAAAVALLHGRLDVDDEDWAWAGWVMTASNTTRGFCEEAVADKGRTARVARGKARAEERRAEGEALGEFAEQDARQIHAVVAKHAEEGDPTRHKGEYHGCAPTCITRSVRRLRGDAERIQSAIRYAVDADWLVEVEGRLSPGGSRPAEGRGVTT